MKQMIYNKMDNQGLDINLSLYDYQRLKSDHYVQDQPAAALACGLCWNIREPFKNVLADFVR